MSPSGRVKVAWAGFTTRACALLFTLPEMAAIGRLTIKKAVPIAVATRQTGRTSTVSMTMLNGSLSDEANVGVTQPRLIARMQVIVLRLVFIFFNHSSHRGCCRI